ncbi:hypothetical protein [Salicola sp. Rm-C-2C1-2]|uniref:hypothetical protein n=1 Tax=Salicola sp. Rm-C-2C1-2 TaxID=3141321 RepID=UPI0032E38E30
MLIHGDQVRLTPRERRVIRRLTGIDPHFIHNRETLIRFRDQHLQSYPTDTPQIRLVKLLLRRNLV